MKLSQAIEHGFPLTNYDPNCHLYLTRDGKRGSVFGCAALGVGMTASDFRAVLAEGVNDAFVYTLRSQIWFVMNQIWPWLSNEHCARIQEMETANGFHDALACVLEHEPAEDDQLPPPRPRARYYEQAEVLEPIDFTPAQIDFIARAMWKCKMSDYFHPMLETMAGEFEKHVIGFDATDFYTSPVTPEKEQQNVVL